MTGADAFEAIAKAGCRACFRLATTAAEDSKGTLRMWVAAIMRKYRMSSDDEAKASQCVYPVTCRGKQPGTVSRSACGMVGVFAGGAAERLFHPLKGAFIDNPLLSGSLPVF
jgi:hypothetical protein